MSELECPSCGGSDDIGTQFEVVWVTRSVWRSNAELDADGRIIRQRDWSESRSHRVGSLRLACGDCGHEWATRRRLTP